MRLYIDENSNNELDSNFISIPVEPVGYSNGYQPTGIPTFQPAVFTLSENETLDVEVSAQSPLSGVGQFGVGIGLQAWQSQYRDADIRTMPVPPWFHC